MSNELEIKNINNDIPFVSFLHFSIISVATSIGSFAKQNSLQHFILPFVLASLNSMGSTNNCAFEKIKYALIQNIKIIISAALYC